MLTTQHVVAKRSIRHRRLRHGVLSLAIGALLSPIAPMPAAHALSCALPPDLTYKQMIREHTTGSKYYDRMVLGKVVTIKDVDPGKGGWKIAKVAAAASPVGWAPLVVRLPFWKPEKSDEPTPGEDYAINYRTGKHYVIIAHRNKDGTFNDDSECGNSDLVRKGQFWTLVRYDRQT